MLNFFYCNFSTIVVLFFLFSIILVIILNFFIKKGKSNSNCTYCESCFGKCKKNNIKSSKK